MNYGRNLKQDKKIVNCLVYKILSGLGKAQMLSIKRIHSKEAKKMN